jgi:hypothetical protein
MNYKPMPLPAGWRLPQAPEQPTTNAAKVISGLFIAEQATGTINPPKDVVASKPTTTILQMPAWKPAKGF